MILPELRTSLLCQILLCASIRIVNRPFSADFHGDCVHIYYPQSLTAEVEALDLFNVEKQLISFYSGAVNLQLGKDNLVVMKLISSGPMSSKELANQLAMFIPLNPATLINLKTSTHIGRSLSLSLSIVLLYLFST